MSTITKPIRDCIYDLYRAYRYSESHKYDHEMAITQIHNDILATKHNYKRSTIDKIVRSYLRKEAKYE